MSKKKLQKNITHVEKILRTTTLKNIPKNIKQKFISLLFAMLISLDAKGFLQPEHLQRSFNQKTIPHLELVENPKQEDTKNSFFITIPPTETPEHISEQKPDTIKAKEFEHLWKNEYQTKKNLFSREEFKIRLRLWRNILCNICSTLSKEARSTGKEIYSYLKEDSQKVLSYTKEAIHKFSAPPPKLDTQIFHIESKHRHEIHVPYTNKEWKQQTICIKVDPSWYGYELVGYDNQSTETPSRAGMQLFTKKGSKILLEAYNQQHPDTPKRFLRDKEEFDNCFNEFSDGPSIIRKYRLPWGYIEANEHRTADLSLEKLDKESKFWTETWCIWIGHNITYNRNKDIKFYSNEDIDEYSAYLVWLVDEKTV